MPESSSASPHVERRRSVAKRVIVPVVVVAAAAAFVMATVGPGFGTIEAVSPATASPVPGTAAPIPSAGEASPAPGASAPASVPAPGPAPVPPAASGDVPASAIDNAVITPPVKTAVAGFITQGSQISTGAIAAPAPGAEPAPIPAVDFTAVAYGSALGELEAQNQEFAANGWQQSGTVQVVGTAETSSVPGDGSALVSVTVCLDSSAVSVVDSAGVTVLPVEPPGTRKNLNTYVVQEVAGVWLVVEHTFPGESGC